MTTRKKRRLVLLVVGLAALGGATALVLSAFSGSLVFFYTPSELAAQRGVLGRTLRIGGLVEDKSVTRHGSDVAFRVTDGKTDMAVRYRGVLPDLFREGQGVVAEGRLLPDGTFVAASVLAKHDEKYMPRAVVEALKKSGRWKEGTADPAAAARPPHSLSLR
ncbi:MAG TPA: cytochrome c maturation protein CcmE [Stellaceae bacterium]|nr:cytochrome c maturation protein CcmE [Stellaceae bacterium]